MTDLCFVADLGSQNPANFTKLAGASWNGIKCEGAILRATRSNGEIDVAYAPRLEQVIAARLLPGAYAFNTGEAPAVQAARFAKATSPDIPSLARFLDFERNPSGPQLSLAGVLEFLDRTDQTFGRYTGLYSGDFIKSAIVAATAAQRDFLSKHPLWGCEYGPVFKDVDVKGKPLPWLAPFLWQDTGDGIGPQPHTLDGLEQGADLSIFKGTRDELAKVWAGMPIVVPPAARFGFIISAAPPPELVRARPAAGQILLGRTLMLKGWRTIGVGLAVAVGPVALTYLAGVDWTKVVSPNTALLIAGALTIGMRLLTNTGPGQKS